MKNRRLEALDVMRGLTIVLMIMVNTALWGTPVYSQLQHALWNGLTAADLVFPFFMFIMGVSISLSLRRFDFQPSAIAIKKILRRTMLIFLVGTLLDLAEKGISGAISGLDFSTLRFTGVLPRLAFSYGIASLLALWLSRRRLRIAVALLLIAYSIILLMFKGFEPSIENIVSKVDVAIFGSDHIYHDWVPGGRIALDPEGLLGLLPSVAHVLIGYLCGRTLAEKNGDITRLLLVGAALTIAGFALSAGIPINKKVWSPTFVMISCGMGASLLGILIYLIDIRKATRPWMTQPFRVFGVNPLALYVLSSLLGSLLWEIPVGQSSLPAALYNSLLHPLFGSGSAMPSLIYSLLVVTACYLVGLILYRRRIYIKL